MLNYKHLPRNFIQKASGLLPMLYSISELSSILQVPARTIHDWLALGVPHQRTDQGRIWINGESFAQWVREARPRKVPTKMKNNQGWCFKCKQAVEIMNATSSANGRHIMIKGICTCCGSKVNRGGKSND